MGREAGSFCGTSWVGDIGVVTLSSLPCTMERCTRLLAVAIFPLHFSFTSLEAPPKGRTDISHIFLDGGVGKTEWSETHAIFFCLWQMRIQHNSIDITSNGGGKVKPHSKYSLYYLLYQRVQKKDYLREALELRTRWFRMTKSTTPCQLIIQWWPLKKISFWKA